jgi:DMSO/TMAO reductase YedYZ heme-binding membrane subunit
VSTHAAATRSRGAFLEGWVLAGLLSATLAAACAVVLGVRGTGPEGLGTVVRLTAKAAAATFAFVFAASSLRARWRHPVASWLLRNRRHLGVTVAAAMLMHFAALIVTAVRWPGPFFTRNASVLVMTVGSLSYVLMWAMAATSFDRSAAWLGARRWKRLHLAGSYLMWAIFSFNYVTLSLRQPVNAPLAALLLAAFALRFGRWRATRRARRAPASAAAA